MNLRFLFEIEYNVSRGQFALIVVLNLELSVWTVREESYFMVDSCYNAFLVVLCVHT